MTDELDERFSHGAPHATVRRDDVAEGEHGEEHADPDDLNHLEQHVLPTEARKTLVPDGRQQLLHVWVRHELWRRGERREVNEANVKFGDAERENGRCVMIIVAGWK